MTKSANQWEAVLDEHGNALLMFARQYVDSSADAEDALQDGFVRFWRSRNRARDALAYLYACVRTAALDLRRSAGRRRQRESTSARPADDAWFDPSGGDAERREAITLALRQLPVEQREVLVMRTWGEATFTQIGEALGVTSKTASLRYREAIDALGKLMSEDLVP